MNKWKCDSPHCKKTCYAEPPEHYCPTVCLLNRNNIPNWRKETESTTNGSQLPKLTAEVFDRPDCPKWAKYAAVDKNGIAGYFSEHPSNRVTLYQWMVKEPGEYQKIDGCFDSSDWQNSLIERPEKKTTPKLTVDVFDREDCPAWAKYAAQAPDGTIAFYRNYPLHDNMPAFNYSIIGDSLIERPEKKETLPDWCTVDAMCWHKRCGYFKVTYIDSVFSHVGIQQVDDKSKGYLSFHTVCNDAYQAHLRPYNEKEMQGLVGKVIEVEPGQFSLCLRVKGYWADFLDDCANEDDRARIISYDCDMLKHRNTIDGKPCGTFEHLENGKWVE